MLAWSGKSFAYSVRRASTKPTTNAAIKPFLINRNPRNLERLRLQRKPSGYGLDKKDVNFWHKLEVISNSRHVVAQLVHNTREVVVHASTNEWAIRKFLYSAKDKQAYITLARVFAERCLESGIACFKCENYGDDETTNISVFLKTLEEEGLILEEPEYYNIYDIWRKKREKKPWTVLPD